MKDGICEGYDAIKDKFGVELADAVQNTAEISVKIFRVITTPGEYLPYSLVDEFNRSISKIYEETNKGGLEIERNKD